MPNKNKKFEDMVMVFRRPKESPYLIIKPEDIRIAYKGFWVDFRDGKILIKSDEV